MRDVSAVHALLKGISPKEEIAIPTITMEYMSNIQENLANGPVDNRAVAANWLDPIGALAQACSDH